MANKYYAVKKGVNPGIYKTWKECQENVIGYAGAIYKSFSTEEEAQSFMQTGASNKFYGVKVGLTPGVYNTWEECQANVSGYPNAKFKSFTTYEEAFAFVYPDKVLDELCNKNDTIDNKDNCIVNGPVAYVDGSCDGDGTRYAFGVAILDGSKEYHLSGFGNDPEMVSMRNVAGEILGAQAAMEYAYKHNMKRITIYHDYQGISSWCLGEWKTNKSGTRLYKERYDEISKYVDINFVKVKGHSNVFYNDVVDTLAKQALGIDNGIKKSIAEHIEKIKNND